MLSILAVRGSWTQCRQHTHSSSEEHPFALPITTGRLMILPGPKKCQIYGVLWP